MRGFGTNYVTIYLQYRPSWFNVNFLLVLSHGSITLKNLLLICTVKQNMEYNDGDQHWSEESLIVVKIFHLSTLILFLDFCLRIRGREFGEWSWRWQVVESKLYVVDEAGSRFGRWREVKEIWILVYAYQFLVKCEWVFTF